MAPQETDPDMWWRHGLVVACFRLGGTECSSACMGPFEGGCHFLHYFHHSLDSGQATGREHSPAHSQKIEDLLSLTPPIRTRSSFPHSQSFPSGSFHKPLILLHQNRQNENHNHRKLTKLITWTTTALSNSIKL